jgi:hypothetical protein
VKLNVGDLVVAQSDVRTPQAKSVLGVVVQYKSYMSLTAMIMTSEGIYHVHLISGMRVVCTA